MIQTTIKGTDQLRGFGRTSGALAEVAIPIRQMERLGQFARDVVVSRVRKGLGADGSAMPPLKGKMYARKRKDGSFGVNRSIYAGWKAKRGLQPFRDLWGTGKQGGHMLDKFTARPGTATLVRIAFTTRDSRIKALANEKRAPFLGFAPQDVSAIKAKASEIFRSEIRSTTGGFRNLMRKFWKKVA